MLFENKYKLVSLLGEGAFCKVLLGKNINTNEEVAIKIESKDSNTNTLLHEAKIYLFLNKIPRIPKLKTFGSNNDFNYLILDKLGISLYDLTIKLGKIPIKNLLEIGKQILFILINIHKRGIIHRDIKPENFLFDNNNYDENNININIIDFGLSTQYIKKNKHISFKSNKNLLGTAIFASINNHRGQELSRRDDLESFIYTLLYCAKGYLPWEKNINKLNISNTEYNNLILKEKENFDIDLFMDEIYGWKYLKDLIYYVRNLMFDESPDYNKIYSFLN